MSTEGTSTGQSFGSSSGDKKRKGRGSNRLDYEKMAKVKATGIQINKVGQPVGENSVIYSSGCGAIATQMVPITYSSWDKLRLGVDESMKVQTLKSMNECWRHYKGRITKQIRGIPPGPDAHRIYEMLKPANVSDQDWIAFVNHRLSPEFTETSNHYRELSKKNRTPHTSSRKGIARLREDLRVKKVAANEDPEVDRVDIWIASHKHKDGRAVNEETADKIAQIELLHQQTQQSIGDDAVSQVFGKEHRGRVRGLGHGVTPSIVQASVIGKQNFAQYQHVDAEMATMKQTIANLTNLLMTNLPNVDQAQILACIPPTQPTQYSSGSNSMGSSKSVQFAELSTKSKSRGSSSQAVGLNDNHCTLLDWMGRGIAVAEAEIESKDPYAKVHHLELGPDYWRVSIKKVMVSVSLPRSTNELLTLEDALNSFIAWPAKYIAM